MKNAVPTPAFLSRNSWWYISWDFGSPHLCPPDRLMWGVGIIIQGVGGLPCICLTQVQSPSIWEAIGNKDWKTFNFQKELEWKIGLVGKKPVWHISFWRQTWKRSSQFVSLCNSLACKKLLKYRLYHTQTYLRKVLFLSMKKNAESCFQKNHTVLL